jgi:hypothetical protein
MSTQDDRVRAVFGLAQSDPLPAVHAQSLEVYYRHLAEHLAFPVEASYAPLSGWMRSRAYPVSVLALGDPEDEEPWIDQERGILCQARQKLGLVHLPLAELEVVPDTPSRRRIADYNYWFWNWQE